MTNNEIMRASLLDILFDGRNKEYGAYAIRRGYNQRMTIALLSAISITLFLCLASASYNKGKKNKKDKLVVGPPLVITTVHIDPKPPELAKPKQEPSRPAQKTIKDVAPVIAPDNEIRHTEVPDNRDLMDRLISDRNVDGPPADGTVLTAPAASGTGNDQNQTVVNDPLPLPTYPPEFPGGMKALQDFLAKNLVTPADLETGDKKIVKARFIVDKDGSVSTVEIDVSGGTIFDKEVIRVCRKMPKWKPAMQNGHPVVISYVLPVTFIGVEQ